MTFLDKSCITEGEGGCPLKEPFAKIEMRVQKLEDWQRGSKEFHENFYNWQRTQIDRDARLDVKLEAMDKNIQTLVKRKEEEDSKPRKFMDSVKENIIFLVIGAVAAYILARIGL